MKIAVFGLGFVGLTTAVGFANKGYETFGFEIDRSKITTIKNGKAPFFENGLDSALQAVINNNLHITDDIKEALDCADIIFYCIGTPMSEDGSADLSYLLEALKMSAKYIKLCKKVPIFVIKSTIPPSSLKEIFLPFLQNLGLVENIDFILANNPEFLREGFAYDDFMNPDRIVIGADFEIDKLKDLYSKFNAPIFFVTPNTAEFIKYLSNTMLSMMISYANDMSVIAKSIGNIDTKKAFEILHLDKRFFGNPANITSYIYPGMGFGGYCLPKDTLALYKKSKMQGYESKLIKEILDINNKIIDFHINTIDENLNTDIGILGLSFKPNSDDVRDSKSYILIKKLLDKGYKNIHAFDPISNDIFHNTYGLDIKYHSSLDSIIQSCKSLIISTAWSEFKNLDCKIVDKKIYNFRYI
ncbi:UDP-glucose/GDP-mannose dehydrogenase family protein [Helicobacter sp. MIT 99-5507]|uniref:UDP-glucose dehydrogenase family protein n=1 Tax=Helicobacter sp. MIT 99-5507 TaxID=152489 RepID=UPI000E1E8E7A|nr:nucleotide sugar dehydrogenase [Helicobacter sp. MIT 99-5507]RDU58446.1 UDP-glucose 6-dehydrogenase [Helicobacter sp. MIT 99-5507]